MADFDGVVEVLNLHDQRRRTFDFGGCDRLRSHAMFRSDKRLMVELSEFNRLQVQLHLSRLLRFEMTDEPIDRAGVGVERSSLVGLHEFESLRDAMRDANVVGRGLAFVGDAKRVASIATGVSQAGAFHRQ